MIPSSFACVFPLVGTVFLLPETHGVSSSSQECRISNCIDPQHQLEMCKSNQEPILLGSWPSQDSGSMQIQAPAK
uniref:Secreted protein n=1 Tax=Arundo donax TaxID=35708 RepID=A0A0A9ELY9_ARUDO